MLQAGQKCKCFYGYFELFCTLSAGQSVYFLLQSGMFDGLALRHETVALRKLWPHRLTVRTSGSHPGNPGSIPGEVTIRDSSDLDGSFLMFAKV